MTKKIYYAAKFWVGLYAFVVLAFLSLQFYFAYYLQKEILLPINTLSYFWTFLISLYCGFDRYVDLKNTTALPIGQMDFGDLSKLRGMILLSLSLLITATTYYCLCKFKLGIDKEFALECFSSGFGVTVIAYVAGNKIIKSQKYKCIFKDENQNNIPDEVEAEFDKWTRTQLKNGVESRFITFDYFLDENPEIAKKYR